MKWEKDKEWGKVTSCYLFRVKKINSLAQQFMTHNYLLHYTWFAEQLSQLGLLAQSGPNIKSSWISFCTSVCPRQHIGKNVKMLFVAKHFMVMKKKISIRNLLHEWAGQGEDLYSIGVLNHSALSGKMQCQQNWTMLLSIQEACRSSNRKSCSRKLCLPAWCSAHRHDFLLHLLFSLAVTRLWNIKLPSAVSVHGTSGGDSGAVALTYLLPSLMCPLAHLFLALHVQPCTSSLLAECPLTLSFRAGV